MSEGDQAAEIARLKAQLADQSELVRSLARNPDRPFKPELPPALSALPENPDSEDQFIYWKRAVELALDPLTGGTAEQRDVQKFAFLFRTLSPMVYASIKEAADEGKYSSCMSALEALYVKTASDVLEREDLYKRRQQPGEDVDKLWKALQTQSRRCGFQAFATAEENRADHVRAAFIIALRSPEIRYRILQGKGENKTPLSGDEALALARSLERAKADAERSMNPTYSLATVGNNPEAESEVLAFTKKKSFRTIDSCKWCGKSHARDRNDCPARDALCGRCREKGHFQKLGPRKEATSYVSNNSIVKPDESKPDAMLAYMPRLFSLAEKLDLTYVTVKVGGLDVQAMVDSGASTNFISEELWSKTKSEIIEDPKSVEVADKSVVLSLGGCCLNLFLSSTEVLYPATKFTIMERLAAPVILGREFLSCHSSVLLEYGGPRGPLKIPMNPKDLDNKDAENYSRCFVSTIKKEAPSPFSTMHPNVEPVACLSGRYKPEDQVFIKDEIVRMLEAGIIEKAQSPWRAQVVVVRNRNKKRLVIDYSQTVNRFTYLDAFPFPVMDELAQSMSRFSYFSTFDLKDAYHQVRLMIQDWNYTAFEADGRLFRFTRLPFGVTNGVSVFQRMMDELIREHNLIGVYAYLDDVTICGNSVDDHEANKERFLEAARDWGLSINFEKSLPLSRSIRTLGYLIEFGRL